jgi:hypothetical protein
MLDSRPTIFASRISAAACAMTLLLASLAAPIRLSARQDFGPYQCYMPRGVPAGAKAPVVLYLHGADAHKHGSPGAVYQQMFEHLADQGYLVIVPFYSEGNLLRPSTWEANAIQGFQAALNYTRSAGRVEPDLNRFAIAGHSLGGFLALRIASLASTGIVPRPQAIILHDAAGFSFAPYLANDLRDVRRGRYSVGAYDRFDAIDDGTLLVALMAEETYRQDAVEEARDGDAIDFGNANAGGVWARAWHSTGIRPDRRLALLVQGDSGRRPPLDSRHQSVESPVDEIDHVYWRVTDAALAAAFASSPISVSDLSGTWTDGRSQLAVFDAIAPPRAFAWDRDLLLGQSRAARWIMPRGAAR